MSTNTAKTNPYDWINPVTDPQLFAGRKQELSTIQEEILRLKGKQPVKPIIVLTGERRVGKTSLLRRVQENCEQQSLKAILIPIDDRVSQNSWDFWHEVFVGLVLAARNLDIEVKDKRIEPMGFKTQAAEPSEASKSPIIDNLLFAREYLIHLQTSGTQPPSIFSIQDFFDKFTEGFRQKGYEGFMLILDEAHVLLKSQTIVQQLRNAIQGPGKCGIVFAGETILGRMFTDPSEPFYGQAHVVPVRNFIGADDIAECALLPLSDDELKLMSPMTIDYIARLSRGKPNQIRLICSSIYKRYMHRKQDDLNIAIDVLDDVLDSISDAYDDPDLSSRVEAVHRLDSVNLEVLHNLTRYPNWNIQDIIGLDESFRGESTSALAIERRKRVLEKKQREFVELGLMDDDPERYVLAGGEFLALYLRFFHETRKHGELSRKLILGKGPPTPFGETTEKLVRSLAYSFGQAPELQNLVFHQYHRDFGDIIGTVKRRFSILKDLRNGKKGRGEDDIKMVPDCFRICELIGKEGNYYLLCLSVRSRDNPRELIQIELYFDLSKNMEIDLKSLFNLLNRQAQDARVLIEGYSGFWVELPDLAGLLHSIGTTPAGLMQRLPLVNKWWLTSVQHAIHSKEETKESKHDTHEYEKSKWIKLYRKGEVEQAEQCVIEMLGQTQSRKRRARLYNDLGYMRFGAKLGKSHLARKDLETALDLHYNNLPLTLSNLSCLDIYEG
jgi:hypothetical protein